MNLVPFYDLLKTKMPSDQLFVFHMPEKLNFGILLLHNLGGAKLDPHLPGYKKGKLQIIVRSSDFESGYAKAVQVMDIFKVIKRQAQGNVFFHFIEPLHDPVAFPASKGNFIEFSVNFLTAYTET
jgi:hypothetical protein